MVTVNGMKMGKSLGNAIDLKSAFNGTNKNLSKAYSPLVIRFFILSSHYRSPLDFSDEALQAAEKGLARLHATVKLVRDQIGKAHEEKASIGVQNTLLKYRREFVGLMDDDFNTAAAIGILFDLNKSVNTLLNSNEILSSGSLQAIDETYQTLGEDILGIIPKDIVNEAGGDLLDGLFGVLITLRTDARTKRDWATADKIRDQLSELGVILEDRPDGTIWKLVK